MLELLDIHKTYEEEPLLDGLSFSVDPGETVCLLGPSGSGKSTLLRIISGLEFPEEGRVLWDGRDLVNIPAHRRNFGLMFQDYALFPHLSVAENVAFGLKMQRLPAGEVEARTREMLVKVNLSGYAERRVTELSGGEQQRVALARALAPHPRLLMFDEPLGALDRTLKDDLLVELRHILHAGSIPAVYVTHDQEEAFGIADRVLLLHEGRIVRSGTADRIWADPGSAWAARFLGMGNVLEGVIRSRRGQLKVVTAAGDFSLPCDHPHRPGDRVHLLVRPTGAFLPGSRKPLRDEVRSVVSDVVFREYRFRVALENGLYFFMDESPQVGEPICLSLPESALQCLP
jgi:spermidine/putrescine transport system ATP-binding protein